MILVATIVTSHVTREYSRVHSPDRRYYAIARYYLYQALIPMMPGAGGDKSGHVTVYTEKGRSCGRLPVERVSQIHELQWSADHADIRLVARWDLAKCSVDPP